MVRLGLWVLLGAVVLAATPPAAAQAPAPRIAFEVSFPAAPLMPFADEPGFPGADAVRVRAPFNVTYTVPAGALVANSTIAIRVVDAPFWLAISAVPATFTADVGALPSTAPRTWVFHGDVLLQAKKSAPAETPGPVSLVAASSGAEASAKGTVSAFPYVIFEASALAPSLEVDRFGSAETEVSVANRGNALAVATVVVAHADDGLVVEPSPAPVVLRPNPLGFMIETEARLVPVVLKHRSGEGGEAVLLVRHGLDPAPPYVQERVVRLHVAVAGGAPPEGAWPLAILGLVAVGAVLFRSRAPR